MIGSFDVFFSYSARDHAAVEEVARALIERGIRVFLDRWYLTPGQPWPQALERAVSACKAVAVFIGPEGLGAWQQQEIHSALDRQVHQPGFPVIPVLLPGAPQKPPGFLQLNTWVDLSAGVSDPKELTTLSAAIRRELPSREAVADFLAGSRPLLECKLIVVGFGGVGKTSLVNRLIHKSFRALEPQTNGINITHSSLTLADRETVTLHVWDFGGQEIMHAAHRFFLTPRSLYLLVLNGRQGREDADANYWLALINSFAGDSPVIIILNKINEHHFDVDRRAIRQAFPSACAFIQTDCKDGTGLDLLDRTIRMQIDLIPTIHDPIPSAWFAIKNRLASMRDDFISFERYRTICAELGENDLGAQEELAGVLHRLGLAIYFREDPRLRDTHVLNPRWLTEGIYTILNTPDLAKRKGELSVAELGDILNARDYPPERHYFIIELMRKFELCFRLPDNEDRYLIPELLDKQEPKETESIKKEHCLNFQYQYPTMLPEGLLPHFIVKTYVRSMTLPRWRTGVVIEFEGNRALVKANHIERRVEMSVEGAPTGRRRLLAVIRNDFASIHTTYKFRPEEMVPLPGDPTVTIPYAKLLVFERSGVRKIPEVIGEEVKVFDVAELLDGVYWERTRSASAKSVLASEALRAFISYSHRDESLRAEFEAHLKLMQRQGLIDLWHDRVIGAGTEWAEQIDENVERADVILLLISADFIASDYCYENEMKRAMERHGDMARVIPVIIRECKWQSAPFGKLQALPTGGKAVTTWGPDQYARDRAWTDVADGVEKAINELRYRGNKT